MRKFYSFVAFALMMVMSLSANAVDFTMTGENDVLQGETYNMRLFKTWDFIGLTCNGNPITPSTLTIGAKDNDMPKCDGYALDMVANEGMEGWYVGIGNMELNPGKGGIYNNKNGVRYMVYSGLKAGQIVVMQTKAGSKSRDCVDGKQYNDIIPNCCKIQKGSADGLAGDWVASFLSNNNGTDVVAEITDEIHAIQDEGAEVDENGDTIFVHDAFRYFKVIEDGAFYMAFSDYAALTGFQVWIDAAAEESVSVPSYKIVGVNHDARLVELAAGESTFGSACSVTYGIMENEGASYEDFEYSVEDGYFVVGASDDEDGDGVVTIQAVTVSETGGISEPVTFQISVGECELNAPTLTLNGFNGEERIYSIGWTNNTLCGEPYTISFEGDNGEVLGQFEPGTGIGELITFKQDVTVTVEVDGYNKASLTETAEMVGTSINRKNADKASEGLHDWDFAHLSDYQKALIQQNPSLDPNIIENCYVVVDADTIYYTRDEYIDGVGKDGRDLSSAITILKPSGWYGFDSGKGRTSLRTVEGGGNDQNADGNGYEDDQAKVWDGLQLSNPPYINSKNELTSSILIYINDDLGLYLGTKPSITFPRGTAAAGEYVLMYIGYGGSNYTNSRYPVIYQVPAGELLSVTLNNNPHIFYIDVYSYEPLPTDEYDDTAIKTTPAVQPIVGYYTMGGAKVAAPQKGVNIVKYADGTTMKIMVK